jgi:hypothetical protein
MASNEIKLPKDWPLAALAATVLFLYIRGKMSQTSPATSVINSPNTPTAAVTSTGHNLQAQAGTTGGQNA